ncbi:hypothetical protein GCM10010358_20870 [Streptomyces minutiscleroticus]|uniref:Uncharacterized protein n=1 Tax=Streptomyces minutiscleroticus TaxID=68238 RepID=A0A918NGX0_9ACTN|nr:hypothetical protein GCM10010358_20870 [Streptomyces minutiscleroticus]
MAYWCRARLSIGAVGPSPPPPAPRSRSRTAATLTTAALPVGSAVTALSHPAAAADTPEPPRPGRGAASGPRWRREGPDRFAGAKIGRTP